MNLARDHETLDWTIDQLRNALQKELRILETGKFVNPTLNENEETKGSIASSFHTGVSLLIPHRPVIQIPEQRSPNLVSTDCKKAYSSKNCKTVTDYQKRIEVIKKENVCFNCLGH